MRRVLSLRDVTVPKPPAGAITDAPTVVALEAHAELLARALAELDQFEAASQGVEAAREADRTAYAIALRKGRADPGSKAVNAATATLENARRTADALLLATQAAKDDLIAVVEDRREQLAADAAAQVAEARGRLREAMIAVRVAADDLGQATSAAGWCQRFPDAGGGAGGVRLLGLMAPNGDPRTLAEVLTALEIFAAEG